MANLGGDLYYTFDFGGTTGPLPDFVYTEFTANQVTIKPRRQPRHLGNVAERRLRGDLQAAEIDVDAVPAE